MTGCDMPNRDTDHRAESNSKISITVDTQKQLKTDNAVLLVIK